MATAAVNITKLNNLISRCLDENHLIEREGGFYPLKLVPLFNVDGPNQRKPFLFKESYDRLVNEIDKLIPKEPNNFRLFFKTECFANWEIQNRIEEHYKARSLSESDTTFTPLCLFREDLLPDSQRLNGTSIDTYASALNNQLFLHYKYVDDKHPEFHWKQTPWTDFDQECECVVMYLKMKKTIPQLHDSFRDMELNDIKSVLKPTFMICSNKAVELKEYFPFQVDLYESLQDLFFNLIKLIKKIISRLDSTFKSVNFTIGKSVTRQKTDKTVFDSCNSNTWDTTNILNRWLNKYNGKMRREKNERDGAYAVMIVLCVITPAMVPKYLRVKRNETPQKGEKETTRSIQELFALTIERTLMMYFKDNPIANNVCIENDDTNHPGKTTDVFDRYGVVYLVYNMSRR